MTVVCKNVHLLEKKARWARDRGRCSLRAPGEAIHKQNRLTSFICISIFSGDELWCNARFLAIWMFSLSHLFMLSSV